MERPSSRTLTYFLGLGSNLGDRQAHLDTALRLLGERAGRVVAVSSRLVTEPWGFVSENAFLNAVCALQSTTEPLDMLHLTQQIERDMGRVRKSTRVTVQADAQISAKTVAYADRIIDIDLLHCFDGQGREVVVQSPELTLPHPLIAQRDFVRIPLAEVMHLLSLKIC